MCLVPNERTKHTASWLNALATALVAAGAFAPAAAALYGLSMPAISGGYLFAACLVVLLLAWAYMFFLASCFLGRLRE